MSILAWIIVGAVLGGIAGFILASKTEGLAVNVMLGIVGAMTGGWLFVQFTGACAEDCFAVTNVYVAALGATAVLMVYHAARRL